MTAALIFDMDGTLIEVSKSYKEAIVQTVKHFIPSVERDVIIKEMSLLVGRKGFNNDWDASKFIIDKLSGRERPVERDDEWERAKDVFQSHYLGAELYRASYGCDPPLLIEKGLIENEAVLINEKTLKKLSDHPMAIATSRTRFEALFALKASFLGTYFTPRHVVSQDDVAHEKPHPEPLLAAMGALDAEEYIYIGDTVDDATAASAAGCRSIIVGGDWGDVRIDDINDLPSVL